MAEIRTKVYGGFRGVDFSRDASMVDPSRSPDGENVYIDAAGAPEKRPGWRTVARSNYEPAVRGIFFGMLDGTEHYLVHAGNTIYRLYPTAADPAARMISVGNAVAGTGGSCVTMGGKMWLATGGRYLVYDGTEAKPVSQAAYVPTVLIGCYPAGGGTFYEAINMMSPFRKNSFVGDGTSTDYYLGEINLSNVDKVVVNGEEKVFMTDYTEDLAAGKVTFLSPPPAPLAGQEDNVVITYSKWPGITDVNPVDACQIITTYGVGARDRVVLSGCKDRRFYNRDWISALGDPSYIPDNSYSLIGSETTRIMGYAPIGPYQAIIKEDNGQDSTIYLRSAELSAEGEAIFPVAQGASGIGAVARGSVGLINDEPVFLSGDGIMGVTSNMYTAERQVSRRSRYIDARLELEPNPERAVGCSWRGFYLLALNGRCYLLDGRQSKTTPGRAAAGEYAYECFFWSNVPARCWCTVRRDGEEELWFGTADGRVCRFNTDIPGLAKYNDDGEPIRAVWSTPQDDDGDPTVAKTLLKKGCGVTVKPYDRCSVKLLLRTDQDPAAWRIREAVDNVDLFDFNDIDFERFSFDTNEAAKEIWLRRKVKRYKRLQIVAVSDGLNEGFGIFRITKHFVAGGFAKK